MRTSSTFLHRHWQELHVKTAPLKHISPPFRDKFFFFQFLWGVLGLSKKDPPIFLIFFNFFLKIFLCMYIYPGKGVLLCYQQFFFSFFLSFPFRSLLEHKTSTAQNKPKKKSRPFAFFFMALCHLFLHAHVLF